MEALFEYLLKASLTLVPFYLAYLLLFKRFTFFRLNRYYLLLSLATSLAIPFLNVGFLSSFDLIQAMNTSASLQEKHAFISSNKTIILTPSDSATPFNWQLFKTVIYLLGASFVLINTLKSLYRIRSLIIKSSIKRNDDNLTIVYMQDDLPSASFFNLVFINNKTLTPNDEAQIIAHEKLHYKQLHSLDILCIELLKIAFWFNPLIYFYKKSLAEIHEFEVDELATNKETRKDYASLLLNLAYGSSINLMHTFSVKPLSTRIKMLFKPKTHSMTRLTYLLFLPVALVATMACQENATADIDPIRTFTVDGVGKNPLVIIDGKEYSAEVLTKIDPDKIQGSSIYGQRFAVEKYGEKAKDGVVKLDTRAGAFTFDNEHDRELVIKRIRKELALPKNQFLSKYTYEGKDGKVYEKIICKKLGGFMISSTRIYGTKVRFFLDDAEKSEAEISNLNKETIERIKSQSVTEIGNDIRFDLYTEMPPPPPSEPNLK